MPREWTLTGRAEEFRRMCRGPATSLPAARGVVLAGGAGVGKSRLAREALAMAGRRGVTVRWGQGSQSARAIPLGGFSGLLGDLGGDPAQLIRRAADALTGGAPPGRVLIGVDDAHLLDELSATLVQQLVREC